jgi:uncharacterized membrane protein HdeD (DUF308 family)
MYPAPSLLLALLLFGAYLQLDGLAALALATSWGLRDRTVWPLAGIAAIGLLGGMVIMIWPSFSTRGLVLLLGVCCLVRGLLEIVQAMRFRAYLRHDWLLAVAGLLSIGFGALLLAQPDMSPATMAWAFAAFVLGSGAFHIVNALRWRQLNTDVLTPDGSARGWRDTP